MMPIGMLSKRTGIHIETIRYYERVGVLPKARRGENGRRIYGDSDVRRLAFIRHARELGFDSPAVKALLALQDRPSASCEAASKLASAQLTAVTHRINKLVALRRELTRMVKSCGNGRVAECQIIEILAGPVAGAD